MELYDPSGSMNFDYYGCAGPACVQDLCGVCDGDNSSCGPWIPEDGNALMVPSGPDCETYQYPSGLMYGEMTWEECKAACENAPEEKDFVCTGLVYKTTLNRCWLKGPECTEFVDCPQGASCDDKQGALYMPLDCMGVPNGSAVEDDCGVCDGGNSDMDDCGVCFGYNASMDECGECGGDGSSCAETPIIVPASGSGNSIPNGPQCEAIAMTGGLPYTEGGTWAECKELCLGMSDCTGIVYKSTNDRCWPKGPYCDTLLLCDDSVMNCDGKKGGLSIVVDESVTFCEQTVYGNDLTCNSDHSTGQMLKNDATLQECKDYCSQEPACEYFYLNHNDACFTYSQCGMEDARVPSNNGQTFKKGECPVDCLGDVWGTAVEDDCGICDGGNSDMDDCGVCFGNNESMDECGVCGGDGSSCATTTTEPTTTMNTDGNYDACSIDDGCDGCEQFSYEGQTWYTLLPSMGEYCSWTGYACEFSGMPCRLTPEGETTTAEPTTTMNTDGTTTTAEPTTTAGPQCGEFEDKKACKKEAPDGCVWNKAINICHPEGEWEPNCPDYNGNKKTCKKVGCEYNKGTTMCEAELTVIIPVCSEQTDKSSCKKANCVWDKYGETCYEQGEEIVVACSDFNGDKQSCKNVGGCEYDKKTTLCNEEGYVPQCTDMWVEVAKFNKKDGKIKHKDIFSTDDCIAKAETLGAPGIIYDLVSNKGLCYTFAVADNWEAGVSADSDEVVYILTCVAE